ncbi:Calcium-dependent protease precursor [Jannaschia seosinensis]|uniref:Calcium-dependent protease n=1 Tax=Jannaschia seosinensis TaxID=313367 RepID=A0A0M7B9N4_9RHOB|nr:S8 family serine peptidase [Jannaschia seosinensis]CUH36785.1 Calcium-dependent protease precursor [Jannaschia seosinensis]
MTSYNDPLLSDQWHLPMIGVVSAWNDYTGRGVTVGVFDDGLDYLHEDLQANFSRGLDLVDSGGRRWDAFPNYVGDPYNSGDVGRAHGTSVAGIIGAEANNGFGGVGIAHGATLGAVDIFDDVFVNGLDQAEALAHMASFDIASNSWGFVAAWDPDLDSGQNGTFGAWISTIYGDCVETGRDGLGAVVVQAAGNSARNAQATGEHTIRETISVAAVSRDGMVAGYSNYGTNILVCAPAASVTTDLTGGGGYSSGNYMTNFGGTSASTPVVSGVAALMLEANPMLGWRDVQAILALSAQQVGSNYGNAAQGSEQEAWRSNGAGNWNGGGVSFNESYGFGMVDALAAVRMAEAWTLFHDTPQTSANELTRTVANGQNRAIRDFETTAITMNVAANQAVEIEYVNVTVELSHTYVPDLVISLVSPTGQEFMLFDREQIADTAASSWSWTFGVTALRGEISAGAWTVKIADLAATDTGTVTDVRLDFHGSAVNADDVHHFTDDFLDFANVEPDRSIIEDTNGGTDWLNLAAVSGDVVLDMDETLEVDGTTWARIAPGQFEKVVTGSGGDVVTGNAGANVIHGMQGDDRLSGGAGADTIYGGLGNDILFGGDGDDVLFGGNSRQDGDDIIFGEGGNDRIYGGHGIDRLFGQNGNDFISGDVLYFGIRTAQAIDFAANLADAGAGGADDEAFIPYRPTGQFIWSLLDSALLSEINVQTGAGVFDVL